MCLLALETKSSVNFSSGRWIGALERWQLEWQYSHCRSDSAPAVPMLPTQCLQQPGSPFCPTLSWEENLIQPRQCWKSVAWDFLQIFQALQNSAMLPDTIFDISVKLCLTLRDSPRPNHWGICAILTDFPLILCKFWGCRSKRKAWHPYRFHL